MNIQIEQWLERTTSNVKRWTKKVKLMFPINVGRQHWICALVEMGQQRIQIYDSSGNRGSRHKRYLDALFGTYKIIISNRKGAHCRTLITGNSDSIQSPARGILAWDLHHGREILKSNMNICE